MASIPPRREKRERQLTGPRVTEAQEVSLMRFAHARDVSVSQVMREAIREYMQRHGFSFDDDDGDEDQVPFRDSTRRGTR
ncbi:hypothetical protein [Aquabacterium sp. OR-4]|uniref:hypothetical protein n=1 Tax=Aquabacterium sp. OR-4 TaxID=2978127 RepID=UPI0021B3C513|nr:hypothetical protein [Aquabacterium sp. OR-4]MDT7834985.1 hypothetical protein [Aquabacterium sp. OR-4]